MTSRPPCQDLSEPSAPEAAPLASATPGHSRHEQASSRRGRACQNDDGPDGPRRVLPHGAWPSPLGAGDAAAGAVRRAEPRVVDGWAYWVEERPQERGRGTVVRLRLGDPAARPVDVPHTCEADIRTAVHEYGGGAWLALVAPDGSHWVLGACMDDQRIRLFDVSGRSEPRPLTPEPTHPRGLRYGDPAHVPLPPGDPAHVPLPPGDPAHAPPPPGDPAHAPPPPGDPADETFDPVTVWVRECHGTSADNTAENTAGTADAQAGGGAGREPRNDLVAVTLDGTVSVVASGADFYSSPRPAPDASALAYLSWDHPNMPWDHTRLHLVELQDGMPVPCTDRVLCDGPALTQPAWSPDGVLHIVTDADGWWAIHRVDTRTGATEPVLDPANGHADDNREGSGAGSGEQQGREFGLPAWVLAQTTYGWRDDGALWCTWMSGGIGHLGLIRDGRLEISHSQFTHFNGLAVAPAGTAVTVAASWTSRAAVVEIAPDGTHRRLSAEEPAVLAAGDISVPEALTFDSHDGRRAHAFFFAPTNSGVEPPEGELAPLLVLSHGGPTGAARSSLDLDIQYWTSRGIAVIDVNYGGSTGYGTAYRNLLDGQWGIVDTQDCIAAALHLANAGAVDGERLAIMGGSAGGFTTLCALVGSDVFAAGISRYGVADLQALARDTHKFESRYLDRLIGPWPAQAELYRERSPIRRVSELRTPMLVLQGTEDKVVPESQSRQVVEALAAAQVPHAYLLFEGEGHGFRRAANIVAALEAELSFLGQILRFEPADDMAPVKITPDPRQGHASGPERRTASPQCR